MARGSAPALAAQTLGERLKAFGLATARVLVGRPGNGADVRQRAAFAAISADEAEKLDRREAAVVRVRERGAERGLQFVGAAHGVEVHDPPAGGFGFVERAEPAGTRQHDRQCRDSGGDDQQRLGPSVPGLPPHAV